MARWTPYTRFRFVLLITGFAPLLLVPLILRAWPLPSHGTWSTSFIYLTGVLHVGMTSFFYLDQEMGKFRRERPHLFITWPLVIGVSATFALTVLPGFGQALINVAFAAWLGWHYTCQQVGVVAIALKSEVASARLRSRERTFIRCTAAVTIIGLVRSVDLTATPLRHVDLLLACRMAFLALVVALVWLLVRSAVEAAPGGGRPTTRAVSLLWATAFMSPVVFLRSPIVATATIAAVHSLHYVFLVSYLSRSRRRWAWAGTLAVGSLTGGVYIVLLVWGRTNGVLSHAVPAMLLTMVAAHRLVDTRVWRLREPERLDYMRRSFQFL